jgi:PKD repeat protein
MKTNLKITRIFLFVLLSLLFASANAQTTLFTEDWETAAIGQTPPSGWGIDLVSGANNLYFLTNGVDPLCSPFSGSRMVEFESFSAPNGTTNRLKRTTPVSTIGYPYVSVDFEWLTDSTSQIIYLDRVEVQWSVNGTSWNTAATIYRMNSHNEWVLESIALPAGAANQATLYIAFSFISNFGDNCHLDLVHVKGYTIAPTSPTIITTHATGIAGTYATLNGYVNANGNSTTGYFEYGTTLSYGTMRFFQGAVTGNSLYPKSVEVTGLTVSTTYHFRLVGMNAGGTTYGNDSVFTTLSSNPNPPTVHTDAATSVTNSDAMLNGHVNPNGLTTTVTFQYGLTTSYGTTVTYGSFGGNTNTPVNKYISGLAASTTYHYRCVGSNSAGTSYGYDTTFVTLPAGVPPTVNTQGATYITSSSARLNGTINPNGVLTTPSFQYGLTTAYGFTVSGGAFNGNTLTPVLHDISGLTPNTLYHFRCVGASAAGTTYGSDSTFTTIPVYLPTVTTRHATVITQTDADLNGTVNANGSTTTVTFDYGPTIAYGTTVTYGPVTGTSPNDVSKHVTGLTPGTLYHFRCVGVNSYGTAYGSDSVFTTLPSGAPIVITNGATNITSTGAALNGSVNPNGLTTTVTFQYGLTSSYGSTVSYGTVNGSYLYPVQNAITGLTPATLYHYRCVGVNAQGTTYGYDTVFTTASLFPPTAITGGVSSLTAISAILNGSVNANGATTNTAFDYGLTPSYGTTVSAGVVNGTSLTPISAPISSLLPATPYHYRVHASNANGTVYGADSVFTTHPASPTVNTFGATNIDFNSATLNGTAIANGSTSTITFEYGLTLAYGSTINGVPDIINGTTTYNIYANLTGLTPATVYHFRIKGVNSIGITLGADNTFMTLSSGTNPPTVFTGHASQIAYVSAQLNGIVNANGSQTTTLFEYGTTSSYGSTIASGTVNGTSNTPINAAVTGLTPGTLYHFRAVGTNAGGTSYGADSTFTTNDSVPLCHANYTVYVHPENHLIVNFYDLSVGNPVSWQWVFSDPLSGTSNFSTLQNPTHYFTGPGYYTVCLTIQGSDTTCHDTFCGTLAIDTTATLHVYGLVTDSVTHNPIPNHPIIIDNDTLNGSFYPYHHIVYTDINGFYNDTIILPASEIPWRFIVRTYDGNHDQYAWWTAYSGGLPLMRHDFEIYSCPNSGCSAYFIAYPDSINPLTYHFIDMSGANITSWYWGFGDGTHSFDRNPTHTFLHLGEVHHVCHTVVDSVNSCCDVYCMDITPGYSGCQANFYFYADSTVTNRVVHFFDSSTGNPTVWSWNFGDANSGPNNISFSQNPMHTFTGPGTFNVCLTIYGDSCSSSYCRNIVITDSVNYHQVYGQVFAGSFPLQLGIAFIFSIDTSQNYIPYVDVSTIDSNGVYYFTKVPDGTYVINAIPVTPAGYLPTYYGDVVTWEQATPLTLGNPNNPYNIHLVAAGTYNPGGGSASGHINTSKIANNLIDKITMTLMDVNKIPIAYCRVSSGGGFDFASLDYGTYYLHPELAGITSDTVRIELTATKPHVDIIMTFTGNRITGTGDNLMNNENVFVYPNPVNEQLNVAVNLRRSAVIRIDVCTLAGQTVYTTTRPAGTGKSIFSLPFSQMTEGMYIVKVYSDGGVNSVIRVIKSR